VMCVPGKHQDRGIVLAEEAHAGFDVLDEGGGFALLVALNKPLGFVPAVLWAA